MAKKQVNRRRRGPSGCTQVLSARVSHETAHHLAWLADRLGVAKVEVLEQAVEALHMRQLARESYQ